jgi:hypothetical protein
MAKKETERSHEKEIQSALNVSVEQMSVMDQKYNKLIVDFERVDKERREALAATALQRNDYADMKNRFESMME